MQPVQGSTSKTSKEEHLRRVWKQTKRKPIELENIPEPDKDTVYLFNYYLEVRSGENLSYCEIEAWSRLTRRNLEPFEVEVLKELDALYWKITYERNSKPSSKS